MGLCESCFDDGPDIDNNSPVSIFCGLCEICIEEAADMAVVSAGHHEETTVTTVAPVHYDNPAVEVGGAVHQDMTRGFTGVEGAVSFADN